MLTLSPEMQVLKTRLKATWESGDYGVFARFLEKGALEFFDRLALQPGTQLLDVACGAGQLLLPAARRGMHATGLDLASNLVRQARARAAQYGLDVRVDEGDAEDLPYADASFDVVISLIGAMFAPQPELVAREMSRVCRPGGRIVMGNWTATGHVGQMFAVIARHVPPPSAPSPLLWGSETTCRQRFGAAVTDLTATRRTYPLEYPFSPREVVDFFVEYYGPAARAFASLSGERRKLLHDELTALWSSNNTAGDGTTMVYAEYIEVGATRR
ncbi:MAG TPA: class I SAM-dependent methyltransferase [Vicinamibacterales bacterium]|nr:class I SAM-dependent methyltransferase [Vicinamibacterales bacterium]